MILMTNESFGNTGHRGGLQHSEEESSHSKETVDIHGENLSVS